MRLTECKREFSGGGEIDVLMENDHTKNDERLQHTVGCTERSWSKNAFPKIGGEQMSMAAKHVQKSKLHRPLSVQQLLLPRGVPETPLAGQKVARFASTVMC